MFKITFEYFNRYDERTETTLHGETKDAAYANAYQRALEDGDGDFSVIALYDMSKIAEVA